VNRVLGQPKETAQTEDAVEGDVGKSSISGDDSRGGGNTQRLEKENPRRPELHLPQRRAVLEASIQSNDRLEGGWTLVCRQRPSPTLPTMVSDHEPRSADLVRARIPPMSM
jgi:hypothetical protein